MDAITGARKKFRWGSAGWATAYHVSLFGAAILSAAAALLLKIPASPKADVAAILATIAALLTTLSSVGSFESKWHADRDAFYRLDELLLDACASDLDADKLRRRLHDILRTQRSGWIGGEVHRHEAEDAAPLSRQQ